MMDVGEAIVYLKGEVERQLEEVEYNIKLLDSENAQERAKKDVLQVLKDLHQGLYQLARNLRKNKSVPSSITANAQICYEDIKLLLSQIEKIKYGTAAAKIQAAQKLFLINLRSVRNKIQTVESFLVKLEKSNKNNHTQA